jgi:hypothetical protein
MQRDLEPPAEDEGFANIERMPFVRQHPGGGVAGTIVALTALGAAAAVSGALSELLRRTSDAAPALVYAWQRNAAAGWLEALREAVENARAGADRVVEVAVCPHAGGRPVCWCRPPLPAMLLAFARRHHVDFTISTLVGSSTTDAAMARALGMRFGVASTDSAIRQR